MPIRRKRNEDDDEDEGRLMSHLYQEAGCGRVRD
jgi:hypothetical protein